MAAFIEHPYQLEYRYDVPFVIWCYWEGEEMSGNRLLSFEYLRKNIQVPICLVTPANLSHFIKKDYPLPESYPYLSIVHRSDYLRAYLLHHYGGGWHDIKATQVSYAEAWEEFQNPDAWMVGRPEIAKGAAKVYDKSGLYMPDYYTRLIAVPSWVGRPYTPLSKEILLDIEVVLEQHKGTLKRHPAIHPREKKLAGKTLLHKVLNGAKFIYQGRSLYYPLEWTLFGNAFHPAVLKYNQHISFNLPIDKVKNAGIRHRQ